MAYLRGQTYIWRGDGTTFCRETEDSRCVTVPQEDVDAFVAMRWAQMTSEEKDQARLRAVDIGEFGADALRKEMGLQTQMGEAMEIARKTVEEVKDLEKLLEDS